MNGTTRHSVLIVTSLCLLCLTPQLVRGQILVYFEPEIVISARTPQYGGAVVFSSAKVTLYRGSDAQRLTSQVIMGHRVRDLTANATIYENRVVSETGEASENVTKAGVLDHCYETTVGAHANAYNRHETWIVGPVCADPPPPREQPDPPDENCPVILDLRQDGFRLSGPDPAVLFDIDADGVRDPIAWTRANDDDAFLCLDRNGNGLIDDGTELFGYATPLRNGQPAQVGYRALAELDSSEAGGNRDGVVDASDARFADLCVWVDRNRDGVSQPQEMSGLGPAGVAALEYRYRVTHLRDSYGNLFRYVSSVKMRIPSGALRSWPSFDVIFTEP